MMALATHSRANRLARALMVALAAATLGACNSIDLPNPFAPKPPVVTPTGPTKIEAGKIPGNDSIPVVVNDRPITRYDITQRASLMRISGAKPDEKAATQDLIDEMLELEEANRIGLRIPPEQVESAYASIAQNLKLTPDDLSKALSGEGIDPATLKRRLQAQITWQQLVAAKARATGQIKETDVTNALLAKGDPDALRTQEYTLQQIVFVVPSGSSDGTFEQRQREAEAFRQRFQGCDKSLAQAQQLKGVVVKDFGRRDSTEVSAAQVQAIKTAGAGGTLRPSRTPQGIEVIAVCSIRDVQSTAAARMDIQNQLFQKQSEGIATSYLKELRSRATIVYR